MLNDYRMKIKPQQWQRYILSHRLVMLGQYALVNVIILSMVLLSLVLFSDILITQAKAQVPSDDGAQTSTHPSTTFQVHPQEKHTDAKALNVPSLRLVILTTRFNPIEQIQILRDLAKKVNLDLNVIYADSLDEATLSAELASAKLVLIDSPRILDWQLIKEKALPLLQSLNLPWIQVRGQQKESAQIETSQAQTIRTYYENGTFKNWSGLFAYIDAVLRQVSPEQRAQLAAPVIFGKTGFYHPDAIQPFSDYLDYVDFLAQRDHWGNTRIGFMTHQGAIASMQTSVIDYIVHSAELSGIQAIVFWTDLSQADETETFLKSLQLNALVNMTHIQGSDHTRLFEKLNIPIIQTFSFQADRVSPNNSTTTNMNSTTAQGESKQTQNNSALIQDKPPSTSKTGAWQQARSGISQNQVPHFLSLPETWGLIEPTVISEKSSNRIAPLTEQIDLLLRRLRKLAALQKLPNQDKNLALLFWNHPDNDKSISASGLNVPKSLSHLIEALKKNGYQTESIDETDLISKLQALLKAQHQTALMPDLLADGLADTLTLNDYLYWFEHLPKPIKDHLVHELGHPSQSKDIFSINGQAQFIIPRLPLGKLIIMPQARRGSGSAQDYHHQHLTPSHQYMASYLYLSQKHPVDALIHFGTHGSQEWLPGKDRGLSVYDYPHLVLHDIPVFYPYIQDNIGEALQAKRRGRATTISHHTPSFSPSGLHDELKKLHDLMHEYEQLEAGPVQDKAIEGIQKIVYELHLDKDLNINQEKINQDFASFFKQLHHHLHTLAARAVPLGLHSFGINLDLDLLTLTVMQQLGEPWFDALNNTSMPISLSSDRLPLDSATPPSISSASTRSNHTPFDSPTTPSATVDADKPEQSISKSKQDKDQTDNPANMVPQYTDYAELMAQEADAIRQSLAYQLLYEHLSSYTHPESRSSQSTWLGLSAETQNKRQALMEQASRYAQNLSAEQEITSLLHALNGGFVSPGMGGDSLRNPDIISGKNLYAFDASKIPTPSAWAAAAPAFEALVEQYQAQHQGQRPDKMVFSLWSSDAIRTLGGLEAQIVYALGLKPIWKPNGSLERFDIIPTAELNRPRIDTVIQVTGTYRDQFDSFMQKLSQALEQLAQLDEANNPIYFNTQRVYQQLLQQGFKPEEAQLYARSRIFGNSPGQYGTGLTQRVLQNQAWQTERELAEQFMDTQGYVFSHRAWGIKAQAKPKNRPIHESQHVTRLSDAKSTFSSHAASSTSLVIKQDAHKKRDTPDNHAEHIVADTVASETIAADPVSVSQDQSSSTVFALHLSGTQSAVFSRSSNLHGMLSTDHPFEFLGGLSAAIRSIDGQSPTLLVNDQRGTQTRALSSAAFIAEEIRTRYSNRHWISHMQQEGYAGTLEVEKVIGNMFGWQVMDPASIREDQWQEMFEVYVQDKLKMDMNTWFETHNPNAQAQLIERMIEAIRKNYWHASAQTQEALKQRWQSLQNQNELMQNPKTNVFIQQALGGYGLDMNTGVTAEVTMPTASEAAKETVNADHQKNTAEPNNTPQTKLATQPVKGQILQKIKRQPMQHANWIALIGLALLLLCLIIGIYAQHHRNQKLKVKMEP